MAIKWTPVGQMRRKIAMQRRTTANVAGEVTETWTDIAEAWAAIEPLSGRELQWAAQVHADATHQVKMYYRSGLTARDRLSYYDPASQTTRLFYLLEPPRNLLELGREMQFLVREDT
jgi:SPP1 family predicted phage head-tail adaptor